jgi:hypothetical protein
MRLASCHTLMKTQFHMNPQQDDEVTGIEHTRRF